MSHNAAHYSLKYGLIGLLIAGVAPLQAVAQSATPDDTVIKTERRAAQQALASGNRVEALRRIEIVVRADPSDLSARFFRAQLLVSMGRGEEIRDEIELLTMLRLPESEIRKARALLAKIDKKEKRLNGKVKVRVQTGYADKITSKTYMLSVAKSFDL